MRVYLDNSVIGRLLDIKRGLKRGSKMLEEDMAILPNLLRLCVKKGIELCVSDDAGAEIEKLRSSMPQAMMMVTIMRESPIMRPTQPRSIRSSGNWKLSC